MKESKTALFETMPIPKVVMKLCIPTVLGTLVTVLYSLADTYFVGMINDPIQNAAVTLAGPLLLAFNAVNNLFGVGTSSMMSRGLGRKDYDIVAQSSSFGFYSALFSSVLFSLVYTVFSPFFAVLLGADAVTTNHTLAYMKWTVSFGAVPAIMNVVMSQMVRSEGSALHASVGVMSGCILNMILDPIFILPQCLGMGAEGAGLATFLSNTAACAYFCIFLFIKRGKTYVCVNPVRIVFRKEVVFGIFGVGIPAAIQNLLNVTGMTILNNFASAYGSDVVASMGISSKITSISFFIAMAMGQGVMPLISYNYAAKNSKRMKAALTYSIKIALIFLTVSTTVYMVFAPQLVRLFMDNDIIVEYGKFFIRGLSTAIPFLVIDFFAIGVFQACGFGRYALFFAFLRKIVLEIPALLILNYFFPIYGLPFAQGIAEFGLCIASIFMLRKIFRDIEQQNTQKN